MGKLNAFLIQLQNQNAIFYPGQVVVGHVLVELNAEMKMREIRLKFEGYANVHWTETHSTGSGKKRRTKTSHYSARENYFDIKVVWTVLKFHGFANVYWTETREEGSGDDRRTVTYTYSASETYFNFLIVLYGKSLGQPEKLGAGQHTFPFQFTLPPILPSSFEHLYGQVRYSLKATIDKPWKFDQHTKQMFTIVSLLDLNAIPDAPRPIQNQAAKTLCCCCCESGPITGLLRLEKSGYVPGEAIYIQGEIQNLSNTSCSVEVRLIMTMMFHATTKTRTDSDEVTRLVLETSDPGKTDSLSGKRIVIPPVAPSYLAGCNIIDIRYYVQLHINPSSMSPRLIVPMEVIIGSIPLPSAFEHVRPPPEPLALHNINFVGAPTPIPTAPDMPEMPPPTYAECVFGKSNTRDADDNKHTKGQMEYAPAYPYYNLS